MNATDAKAKYEESCRIVAEFERLLARAKTELRNAEASVSNYTAWVETAKTNRRFDEDFWYLAEQFEDAFKRPFRVNPNEVTPEQMEAIHKCPAANEFRRTLLR